MSLISSISLLDFTDLESNIDIDGQATFGGIQGRAQTKQDPPIERDLILKLEEVYNGCTKKMKNIKKSKCMIIITV